MIIDKDALQAKNKRLIIRLSLVIVGMFVFAVGVLPPLYSIFCEITGLNGKVDLTPASEPFLTGDGFADSGQGVSDSGEVLPRRQVKVSFVAQINKAIPWSFEPIVRSMRVAPGNKVETSFYAKNLSSQEWVGQAVPSISPAEGTGYFKKIECFCFTQQTLAAGESSEMPLIFYLEEDIPESIKEITLAYTLYPAKKEKDQTALMD